jgi:hypothetical protein
MQHKSFPFLGLAGKRLATGAIVAAFAAIAFGGVAHAGAALKAAVTTTVTGSTSPFLWDYTIANDRTSSASITEILIPELNAGDLSNHVVLTLAAIKPGFANQNGWTITEATTPFNNGSGKFTPAAVLDLKFNTDLHNFIAPGRSLDFLFDSKFGAELASTVEVTFDGSGSLFIDPSSPDSRAAAAAPEPTTLALFGSALLGLVGWRRRQRG